MYTEESIKIFAVEDDPTYIKFLKYILELNPDHQVEIITTGQECIDRLHEKPTLITLDYTLPDISGEEVLRKIKNFDASIPVIIISGQEEIGTAVDLLKLGAYDYLIKNEETKDKLLNAIGNARKNVSLVNEIATLKEEISQKYEFGKSIIGNSPAIKQVFSMLEKAVKTNITVSITGETGTGKELAAKAVHYNSEKKKMPFVAVNIAAIPNELIESELFGHEKGAFTGAVTRRLGKFEEANGGTIFLDEIGEMDLNLQSKLLRVLQEKEVTRVGGNEIIKVNARVVVATHRNLAEEVQKGTFREDLYYRLLGLPIKLPSLRERGNDIIIIARYLLNQFCKENNLAKLTIGKSAQEKLLKYHYPGNVRELKSIIELSAVLTNSEEISEDEISFNSLVKEDSFTYEELTLKEYTNKIIQHFLNKHDHNVIFVAKKLDIGKSTIYRYLKELELAPA